MDKREFNSQFQNICGSIYEFLRNCEAYLKATETAEQAYQRGLDEACGLAKRLIRNTSPDDLRRMGFGDSIRHENLDEIVLNNFTASEALAKIREYKARKKAEDEAVKVGDEVKDNGGFIFVVVKVFDGGKRCAGYNSKGEHIATDTVRCRKTGRHFQQIAEVLGEIRDPDGKEDA